MTDFNWPLTATPRIRTAGRFPLADQRFVTTYRGPSHALHLHDYAARMDLGGRTFDLMPGDLTITPAGCASGYHLAQPGRHWCVHFWPDDGAAALALPFHLRLGTAAGPVRDRIAQIAALQARATEPGIAGALAEASASVALQGLLLTLAEQADRMSAGRERRIDDAVDAVAAAIDTRFDEPLTAAALVAATGFSHNHLGRQFRTRLGVTIAHRLLQRRLEHARFLLEATDLPVWRVGERVGIPDPHHFNKTVRRLTGRSPSQLRGEAGGRLRLDPDR